MTRRLFALIPAFIPTLFGQPRLTEAQEDAIGKLKAAFIEDLQHILFESNDAETRKRAAEMAKRRIVPYIRSGCFISGFIVCDETNNTPETIRNGEFIMSVNLEYKSGKYVHFRVCIVPEDTNA